MTFNDDFLTWLEAQQNSPVYYDLLPDTSEDCVFFHTFSVVPETLGVRRYIQVQVLRKHHPDSYRTAWDLAKKLDSGIDEDLVSLSGDRQVVIRPTARPRFMSYDDRKRAKHYFEIVVFDDDKE